MEILTDSIVRFFKKQNFVIVSTIDKHGHPHSSCKGVVDINEEGVIYLLDLYTGSTYTNLVKNPNISLVAVDEHKFVGYCLKGKALILESDKIAQDIVKKWSDKIASRVTHRVIKQIKGEKGHPSHPEVFLPTPKYMIKMNVNEVVDLTPPHLK